MGSIYIKLRFYMKINWVKTIYFNFKKFEFAIACKLPVFFYGPVRFQNISGDFIIEAPIKRGMIGFGQPYEKTTVHRGIAELAVEGKMIFNGHVQFGKDYFIYVAPNATAQFGHMASMASTGKIICTHHVTLGDYARIGSESQVIDTTFHQMTDTITGEKLPIDGPVILGNFNYVGNRVSIMKGTVTPDYCTIASMSVCNKDYNGLGQNVMIGGIPAKLIRKNTCRDWEGELDLLNKWLII